jgi:hypothetical protein
MGGALLSTLGLMGEQVQCNVIYYNQSKHTMTTFATPLAMIFLLKKTAAFLFVSSFFALNFVHKSGG